MTDLFLVFIAACLANNLVLEYLLGISPVFAVSRIIETAIGMSLSMLIILPVTTLSCWVLHIFILKPLQLEFLQLLAFVITISFVTFLLDLLLQKLKPKLHENIVVFIPLLLVNTSLLGVALLEVQKHSGIFTSLIFGMGAALGFGITVVIFSALRQRITHADVPHAFRGTSILLITLGIMSMAFMGFIGIV